MSYSIEIPSLSFKKAVALVQLLPSTLEEVSINMIPDDRIFEWVKQFPRARAMCRYRVDSSKDALKWALAYPQDRHRMRPLVTAPRDMLAWVKKWPEDAKKMPGDYAYAVALKEAGYLKAKTKVRALGGTKPVSKHTRVPNQDFDPEVSGFLNTLFPVKLP